MEPFSLRIPSSKRSVRRKDGSEQRAFTSEWYLKYCDRQNFYLKFLYYTGLLKESSITPRRQVVYKIVTHVFVPYHSCGGIHKIDDERS
ncbi:hypothetical protein CEXT_377861 [Caerostris extrusa]|uniref:Uncharacterized protein n=1 Tax=Caerostris extrusa TaxID=172846 RepID=A0AAV4VN94_CAEEX|nr:hypothetical protein CEXT_377861 [Caerostris extrusa]